MSCSFAANYLRIYARERADDLYMLGEDSAAQARRVPCEKEGEKLRERCALNFWRVSREDGLTAFGEPECAPCLGRAAVFCHGSAARAPYALAQRLRCFQVRR